MAGQTVIVSVLGDTSNFKRQMAALGDQTSGLDKLKNGFKTLAKVAGAALVGAGIAGVAFGKQAVTAAADLEQSIGAVDTIFKGSATQMHTWAKGAADAAGLSRNEYNELSSVIGAQFKNMGVSMDQLAPKTNQMITLGADLSSMFGGTTKEAVEALSSAFKGEMDPIERYGISLNQAKIDAELARMGMSGLTGAAADQARQMAITNLITQQSADAQGNFAKESNTLAGQQQRLKAKFENIKATLGTYLLPIITKVTAWLSDNMEPAFQRISAWIESKGIPAAKRLAEGFQQNVLPALQAVGAFLTGTVVPALGNLAQFVGDNAGFFKALGAAVLGGVVAFKAYTTALKVWKTVSAAAKVAQIALNVAMAANPIGIIITAIGALVGALVWFFTQTETGRKIWDTVWTAISTGAKWLWENVLSPVFTWIGEKWNQLWTGIQILWQQYGPPIMTAIQTYINNVKIVWETVWNVVKTVFETVWNVIKTVVETVMGIIQGVIKTVTSVIKGDWQGAWEGIKQIFSSVWNGIKSIVTTVFNGIKSVITSILNGIKGVISNTLNGIKSTWTSIWNAVKTGAQTIWNNIKTSITQAINNVMTFIRNFPQSIKNVFAGAASWLLNAGRQIIDGFLNGISAGFNRVRSKLNQLTSMLPSWKGPERTDKTILENAGELVISGFINGLESQYGAVKKSLKGLTKTVATTDMGTLDAPGFNSNGSPISLNGYSAAGAGTTVVNITVNAPVGSSPADIGREIEQYRNAWLRQNGR